MLQDFFRFQVSMFQSTHPRGVRRSFFSVVELLDLWFQSTHPRGVRQCVFYKNAVDKMFQSTHPRGVRLQFIAT